MSEQVQCPDDGTIRRFADEKLDDDTMERLRPHVETCRICRETLARFDTRYGATQITEDWVPKGDDKFDPGILTPSTKKGSIGRLGDYEIVRTIGSGGMGVVLEGFDENLQRAVAIKVLARQIATSEKSRRRFTREARAVAAVKHANIVTIHAVDEQKDVPFIVMEYVRGNTLHERIVAAGQLDPIETLRISNQIAAGLAAAHEQGVIHRDIKPANIMLEGDLERVKITDFGLARAAVDNTELTSMGETVGTPAYMSPEQISGGDIDERTDLFSLGIVMYAMLSGRSPFQGGNTYEVIRRVCDVVPEPLHEITKCPRPLSDLVARLLEKAPKDRFESAQYVASTLASQLSTFNQASTEKMQRLLDGAESNSFRSRWSKWIIAAVFVAVISAGIGFAVYNNGNDVAENLNGDSHVGQEKTATDQPPTDPKVEEAAAKWVFDVGGLIKIRLDGELKDVEIPKYLPDSDFWIEHIDLALCFGVDDESIKNLEGLVRLNHLQLNGTDITNEGLKHLSRLVSLDYLGLKSTSVTDDGLAHLASLPNLTRINLMDTQVTDHGFSHLQDVTTLTKLYLSDTNLGDDAIPYFEKFENLQVLEMAKTRLSDEGLRRLAARQTLEALYLSGTNITDDGVPHLLLMRNLRILDIKGIQLSDEKIWELRKSLPDCDVLHQDH